MFFIRLNTFFSLIFFCVNYGENRLQGLNLTETTLPIPQTLQVKLPLLECFEKLEGLPEQTPDCRWLFQKPKDLTRSPDVILLHYYGGYSTSDKDFKTDTNARFEQRKTHITDLHLSQNNIARIFVETDDSNQSIFQADQFAFYNPQGRKLLIKTTLDFLHFASQVKRAFPKTKLVYEGESFGGTKGNFINILLSNKETLNEIFPEEIADSFNIGLKNIKPNLFDGFILHASNFLWYPDLHTALQNPIVRLSTPTLLTHNFDDDRVDVRNSMAVFAIHKRQKALIFLHICPQGARYAIQSPDGERSSLDGHGFPYYLRLGIPFFQKRALFIKKIVQNYDEQFDKILSDSSFKDFLIYLLATKSSFFSKLLAKQIHYKMDEQNNLSLWTRIQKRILDIVCFGYNPFAINKAECRFL